MIFIPLILLLTQPPTELSIDCSFPEAQIIDKIVSLEQADVIHKEAQEELKARENWAPLISLIRSNLANPKLWIPQLLNYLNNPPNFAKDPNAWAQFNSTYPRQPNPLPIDQNAKEEWSKELQGLIEEILASKVLEKGDIDALLRQPLFHTIRDIKNAIARGETPDHHSILNEIAQRSPLIERSLPTLVNHVFGKHHQNQMTYEELLQFTQALKESPSKIARSYGRARERMLLLAEYPMDYRGTTLDGQTLDLRDYRGKYVLLQIWPYG